MLGGTASCPRMQVVMRGISHWALHVSMGPLKRSGRSYKRSMHVPIVDNKIPCAADKQLRRQTDAPRVHFWSLRRICDDPTMPNAPPFLKADSCICRPLESRILADSRIRIARRRHHVTTGTGESATETAAAVGSGGGGGCGSHVPMLFNTCTTRIGRRLPEIQLS